ncbi:hypothetical protein HXX02_06695 [Microbulbifer elongatus]|uniref:Phosphatidate cytidylyltransferase n=1 Tax=Microbulbifer elongatus TaxID=86173 RepID=A0ABT1P0S0_9GAMM|nr:hypothetical protein [Microbulbifer elongatus]MCQ3829127.1 hypothetical protein [Microbulbifer elongatus]
MSTIKRILIAVVCLFAAIACYVFGIPAGGAVFLVLGFLLEGLFWFQLTRRKRAS